MKKEEKRSEELATPELAVIRAKHDLKAGTPTGLGVLLVIVITALFALLFPILKLPRVNLTLLSGYPLNWEIAVIFLLSWVLVLIGLYDDILKIFGFAKTGFGLRRWHKFGMQWAVGIAVAALLYFGLKIDFIYVPFLGIVRLGWSYLPLAALIVGFANAYDFYFRSGWVGEGLLMVCLMAFLDYSRHPTG